MEYAKMLVHYLLWLIEWLLRFSNSLVVVALSTEANVTEEVVQQQEEDT